VRFFLLDFFAEVTRSSADRHSFLAAAVAFRRVFFRSPTVDFLKAATFVLRAGDFFADARFFRRAAFLCGIFRSSLMVKGSSLEIDQCKASGFRRVDFRIAWKGLNSSQVIFCRHGSDVLGKPEKSFCKSPLASQQALEFSHCQRTRTFQPPLDFPNDETAGR
jgi:hypothetical protein